MKVMEIIPRRLTGALRIIPSKSASHRALICAALAPGQSRVDGLIASDDTKATLEAISSLGMARSRQLAGSLSIAGGETPPANSFPTVDCAESGSTIRFLIPVSLLFGGARFIGRGRLLQRPMEPLRVLLEGKGVLWQQDDALSVRGTLQPGDFSLPGDVSSQFISGLLFALPLLPGDSRIVLTTEVQSRGYIELTRQMQSVFGIRSQWLGDRVLQVPGHQTYRPAEVQPEGDWSHAAFYLAAGAMGGSVRLSGLRKDTLQGDRAMESILRAMGADVFWDGDRITAQSGSLLSGVTVDVSQTPDLVPAVAAAACGAEGVTRIVHAERLRGKESDRLRTVREEFGALGAEIEELPDGLVITGRGALRGGRCRGRDDHRIAMALAAAACICREPVYLEDYSCVSKSAPDFWEEFRSLGGMAHERELGQPL